MQFRQILYRKGDGIATIILNRAHVLNALSPTMIGELVAVIENARYDDDVRVLVVTGAGRGFCSGADVKALAAPRDCSLIESQSQMQSGVQRIPRALETLGKPYIASINGPAVGGGFDLASMADIRIASERATFAINHLRIAGLSLDGGYYFLTRILGVAKTLELVLTCRFFDAHEALQIGYVNKIVPHDKLSAATKELATQLVQGPPVATQFAKRLIRQSLWVSLDKHLEDVEVAYLLNERTDDFKEGPKALMEKRPPVFKGK